MTTDEEYLSGLAQECVALVAAQYDRTLDGSLDSLDDLDAVCAQLTAEGPLTGDRLSLWWRLIGSYTGEAVIRAYGGHWTRLESVPGGFAIAVNGITAMPFSTTQRILSGEPYKSLGSFARVMPALFEREEQRKAGGPQQAPDSSDEVPSGS